MPRRPVISAEKLSEEGKNLFDAINGETDLPCYAMILLAALSITRRESGGPPWHEQGEQLTDLPRQAPHKAKPASQGKPRKPDR